MTWLVNDPTSFVDDMLAGFLDAHSRYAVGVPGGVVRVLETRPGKVALIVGGGSGHYPAFAGIVGPGLADAAVVGNVFASPSQEQAHAVAIAAHGGAGVVFGSGNYAGDVLNFTAAVERLNSEGTPARVVYVTDDVASAPVTEIEKRRGIAGDIVVFKVGGAAAEAGYALDDVVRVMTLANDRTRTLGVAFSGCTLPGAEHPLFTVPDGKMGVGLGIHGEPGIREADLLRADELAMLLVEGTLAELHVPRGSHVAAILNGLGSTKQEELFVLWGTVSHLLRERGLVVVDPEVGELVTSLDMAGCSLTITHLDEELESLWRAPADTPAFRRGVIVDHSDSGRLRTGSSALADVRPVAGQATQASQACAVTIVDALVAMQDAIADAEAELGDLDAVAGDGDHGRGMMNGISAAVEAAQAYRDQPVGAATLLTAAGDAWAAKAGGTSGALWGAALSAIGSQLGDAAPRITPSDLAAALRSGLSALQRLGGAEIGDKTMIDAYLPFLDTLDSRLSEGAPLAAAWSDAAAAATRAAQETAALRPRIGRARPLAERSVGTPDAGAVSLALCVTAIAPILRGSTA